MRRRLIAAVWLLRCGCRGCNSAGPGIPPEARDRIFERYLRLDPHARPVAGGLGLGLYIARRLTDANGGELRCTDPPGGRGACFELRLPIARPALA